MDLLELGQDALSGRGRHTALLLVTLAALLAMPAADASAAARPALEQVRTVWTSDLGLSKPTGMTFSRGSLLVAQDGALRRMTLLEDRIPARARASERRNASARVAVDTRRGVRYVLSSDARSIRRIPAHGA